MKITRIDIIKYTEDDRKSNNLDNKLLGIASITLDFDFIVHDINIMDGDKGKYLIFPTKGPNKYVAYPIKEETRQYILNSILDEYYKGE